MKKLEFAYPSVILSGGSIGLWVTRELGKHSVHVQVVAKSKDYQVAFYSKYCKERTVFPGPWDFQKVKRLMRRIAKTSSKRIVVYPMSDIDALNLSRIKDELKDDFFIVIGSESATETLVNKQKFYQSLETYQIDHPKLIPDTIELTVRKLSQV